MKKQKEIITDDVKQQREHEAKEEIHKLSEESEKQSQEAKEKLKQNFESMSDNKSGKFILNDLIKILEMNFSDVFKNIKLKDYTDEMGSMINEVREGASKRVGGLLQMRKKLFKETKQQEVEKIVNKMNVEKEKADLKDDTKVDDKQDESKVDDSKDSASEATDDSQAAEEHIPEDAKTEAKDDVPKESAMSKIRSRISQTGDSINEKAPFLYKSGAFIKDLWNETFPSDSKNVKTKIEKRKEIAQMQQNYTEEEIEQMQEEIPDWKRTAVTMVDEEKLEAEQSGYLKRMYKSVGNKISDTSVAKKILESEEYKEFKQKYREIKTEATDFKEDLREEVETAQNPVVGNARSLSDYVLSDTSIGQATAKMKEYDIEFDINDLHYEVEEIFTDMFDSYLEGDQEYLEKF